MKFFAFAFLVAQAFACSDTNSNSGDDVGSRDTSQDVLKGRDVASPDTLADAANALSCQSEAEAKGWSFCSGDRDSCSVKFEDSTGCPELCQQLGLRCEDSFDDVSNACEAETTSLGCADTGHVSDFCVCGVGAASGDAGTDASTGDSGTCTPLGPTEVYLIGDSTVATDSGWGDALQNYMSSDVTVTNRARGGRSSKSFYDEGAFDSVRSAIGNGDFVLIQFGHNDSKQEAYRRTEPGSSPDYEGSFRTYLELYINEIRAEGATPILLTSVSRMVFSSDGTLSRTHGNYAPATRKVAQDNNVTLLDLEEESYQIFQDLGEDETLRLFAEGSDRTHFPASKAFRVTEMVTSLLEKSDSPLRCMLE